MKDIHYYIFSFIVLLLISVAIGLGINKFMPHVKAVNIISSAQRASVPPAAPAQEPATAQASQEDTTPTPTPPQTQPEEKAKIFDQDMTAKPYLPQQQATQPATQPEAAAQASLPQSAPKQEQASQFSPIVLEQTIDYPAVDKAEQLYNGAFPLIKQIMARQKEYYNLYQKYSPNPKDLNIAFKDVMTEVQPLADQNRVYLRNGFYYVFTPTLIAAYQGNPFRASQMEEYYHIDFFYNGDINCVAHTVQAGAVCRDLGGDFPTANKRIPSWIIYQLPKDFLDKH